MGNWTSLESHLAATYVHMSDSRDLLDDYNKYIFAGFWVAIVVLPSAAAAKKQAEEAQVQVRT